MIELLVCKDVLSEILYENKTFKRALSDQCFSKKEHSNIRRTVSALVGCELRHHFLVKKVLDKLNLELTLDQRTFLYLALANNHFLKALDIKGVNSQIEEVFSELYSKVEPLLDPNLNLFEYLNINKKSFDYISIRFNLPKWLLKSWAKEIGLSKTYRIIHQLTLPNDQTYRINEFNEFGKEFIEKHKNLLGEEIYPGIVRISRKTMSQNPDLKCEFLFEIDYRLKRLIDNTQSSLVQELSIYSDEDDSLPFEELARSKGKLGVNVVCPSFEERTNLVRTLRISKAKNINVFKAGDVIAMKTGISRDSELFYCYPKSSSYSCINKYPDYIVRFRNTQIDGLVDNQKNALEKCSEFICDGGELVYIVNTLNKRETKDVIEAFLQSHPSFKLVKDEQFYPDQYSSSFLYYAVLKLEKNHGEN